MEWWLVLYMAAALFSIIVPLIGPLRLMGSMRVNTQGLDDTPGWASVAIRTPKESRAKDVNDCSARSSVGVMDLMT